jgi:hypothetical protein
VANDYTLRYRNKFLQLAAEQRVRVRPGSVVVVEERLDGGLHLRLNGAYLRYKTVEKPPYRGYYATNKSELREMERPPKGSSVPGKDHPWRRFNWPRKNAPQQTTTAQLP